MHDAVPPLEYVPPAQFTQWLAESGATLLLPALPGGHALQVSAFPAPAAPEYLPTSQEMHELSELWPVAVEYLPAAQGPQVLLTASAW